VIHERRPPWPPRVSSYSTVWKRCHAELAKHLVDAATGRDGGPRSFVPGPKIVDFPVAVVARPAMRTAVKDSVFHDSVAPHRGMFTQEDTSAECRTKWSIR
jgi:hypothetical protein